MEGQILILMGLWSCFVFVLGAVIVGVLGKCWFSFGVR